MMHRLHFQHLHLGPNTAFILTLLFTLLPCSVPPNPSTQEWKCMKQTRTKSTTLFKYEIAASYNYLSILPSGPTNCWKLISTSDS